MKLLFGEHPGKPAAATFPYALGSDLKVTNSISYALWTHENSEVLEEIPTEMMKSGGGDMSLL